MKFATDIIYSRELLTKLNPIWDCPAWPARPSMPGSSWPFMFFLSLLFWLGMVYHVKWAMWREFGCFLTLFGTYTKLSNISNIRKCLISCTIHYLIYIMLGLLNIWASRWRTWNHHLSVFSLPFSLNLSSSNFSCLISAAKKNTPQNCTLFSVHRNDKLSGREKKLSLFPEIKQKEKREAQLCKSHLSRWRIYQSHFLYLVAIIPHVLFFLYGIDS